MQVSEKRRAELNDYLRGVLSMDTEVSKVTNCTNLFLINKSLNSPTTFIRFCTASCETRRTEDEKDRLVKVRAIVYYY